jgi:hypothetical protein
MVMAIHLPADLQLWLSSVAERQSRPVEDVLLDVLYDVMARDHREQLEQAKTGPEADTWSGISQEAVARRLWERQRAKHAQAGDGGRRSS